MKVVNCQQMREIDEATIKKVGIPGIVLMENAAIKVVEQVVLGLEDIAYKSILVFCGRGNNGGDGFAIARHLFDMGANVLVVLMGSREGIKGDAYTNLQIIENLGVRIVEVQDESHLEEIAASLYLCDMVIDAILGTGVKGKVEGPVAEIIRLINYSGRYVIAVDIPSGINGDTGEICGICVDADKTVTFALPKLGLLSYPAANYVGELIVADISIPTGIIESLNIHINIIEKEYVQDLLPARIHDANKGDYGKLLIVAGSVGMTGAAVLTSKAAMRSGAGLVTAAVPRTLNDVFEQSVVEVMCLPLEDEGKGVLSVSCTQKIIEKLKSMDAVIYGPGLSMDKNISQILYKVIEKLEVPIVIDADGINSLAKNINVLKACKCPVVVTPHPGEMARLTGLSITYIQENRVDVALKFAQDYNVVVVLKGARTVVASPEGYVFLNCTGNAGMATAGSGDVLTGIIGSLMGQGLSVFEAAISGVYIHGIAGDFVAKQKGQCGLIASDIITQLPFAFKQMEK